MLDIKNQLYTWATCREIEKDINDYIAKYASQPIEDARTSMEKDIPRLLYCIEGTRVESFSRLQDYSKRAHETKWVNDNIHGLVFVHQGLYQIVIDHLHMRYNKTEVMSVGFDGNSSSVIFDFFSTKGRFFISMSAGAHISALLLKTHPLPANRNESYVNVLLTLEYFPEKKSNRGTVLPTVKVARKGFENSYSLSFSEYSSPLPERRVR